MILREATISDWELLLHWRNDVETRKNSHNMDLVDEQNHKQWLTGVIENPNRKLFIAFVDDVAVGTVRADFDEVSEIHHLSWTVSPNARGQGVGKRMVRLCAANLNAKIRAEIKEGNESSVKIAEHAGLRLIEQMGDVLHYSN